MSDNDDEYTYKQLSIYLTEAFLFMKEFEYIPNSYVAEFFTQDLWNKIPLPWRKCLENASLKEVALNVLRYTGNKTYTNVWPLSLLSFVATCHALALDREQTKLYKNDISQQICNIFRKHIKPKKRHELSILPEVIHDICERTGTTNIVDVGSGLGHLSRFLAYKYGYNVTAIEMTSQRLPIAERFDKEMQEELQRISNKVNQGAKILGKVTHIAKRIDADITSEEFCALINGSENKSNNTRCILIGLHTCGDLASTMLNVFKTTPMLCGIVSVSCCYFRMTLKEDLPCCDSEVFLGKCDHTNSGLFGKYSKSNLREMFSNFSLTSLSTLTSALVDSEISNVTSNICKSMNCITRIDCKDGISDNRGTGGCNTCEHKEHNVGKSCACPNIYCNNSIIDNGNVDICIPSVNKECSAMGLCKCRNIDSNDSINNNVVLDNSSSANLCECPKLDCKDAIINNVNMEHFNKDEHKKCTTMLSCECLKIDCNDGIMNNGDTDICNAGEYKQSNVNLCKCPKNYGFPLSMFLQNIPCQPLKYKSFETACHFIDDYSQKLMSDSPNLKLHCYRAVMEVLLRKIDPQLILATTRCRKIKNAASMSFSEYAEKVFERLNKTFDLEMVTLINGEDLLLQWRNVAVYHSLALLFGPAIESIALVDKWMYLLESGFNVSLLPLFDPKISPRNFVVIGTRK